MCLGLRLDGKRNKIGVNKISQTIRQSNLFAAEDWRKIYRAFTQVNFNAYDFNSIKLALVEYLKRNYPEDFNDYIDTSEFIAIIDMISYLGQSLAFRMDLNSQENFMDTANRRESILKLARMLSYKPKRNIAARGLVKILSVRTNDDIYDSNATNINGLEILWNDPNNPDWFEQFTLVMNSLFTPSNPFGQPVEKATIGNVKSHIYRLNNQRTSAGQFGFNAFVDGASMPFELVNVKIQDKLYYQERNPDTNSAFHLIYQNDGNGNQSKNTGFFVFFKQGSLRFEDFNVAVPVENRILSYSATNVNETDVWVQTVDEIGNTMVNWTKVPAIETNNVIFNDIDKDIRNVFSVLTESDNKISVRFGDGRFGNVPTGLIRCWHRVSENRAMTIRPQDIRNIGINIPYFNKNGVIKGFGMTVALQETVTNSQPGESDEEIRRRAPQVYYTQNRMVSGEDYNVFTLDDTTIGKVKAINRTYSGHSRYIDINDPTGYHQNTNIFADDGLIYKEPDNNYQEVQITDGLTPDEIIYNIMQPMLGEEEFKNYIYGNIRQSLKQYMGDQMAITQPLTWDPASSAPSDSSGLFLNSSGSVEAVGSGHSGFKRFISAGGMVKFEVAGWVGVQSMVGSGNYIGSSGIGAITLTENVKKGDRLVDIMPKVRTSFTTTEIDDIRQAILDEKTFALMYDITKDRWFTRDTNSGPYDSSASEYRPSTDLQTIHSKSWIQLIEFKGSSENPFWAITNRGLRYIFESVEDVRFFFVNDSRVVDRTTGLLQQDHVNIFKLNGRPEYPLAVKSANPWVPGQNITVQYNAGQFVIYDGHYYLCMVSHTSFSNNLNAAQLWSQDVAKWKLIEGYLPFDIKFNLDNTFVYEDGHTESRKVLLSYPDSDQDGIIDNPEIFDTLVYGAMNPAINDPRFYIHFERYTSYDGYDYYRPKPNTKWFPTIEAAQADYSVNAGQWVDGEVFFVYTVDVSYPTYWSIGTSRPAQGRNLFEPITDKLKYINYVGRENLNFQWKHYAVDDHRLDPAITNIIDMFVLSQEYDFLLRQWVLNNGSIDSKPEPDSIEQLRLTYSNFDQFKMISDQLVWHPVKYKMLFGARAEEEYKATVKVTKLPDATLSDGEIKASVIAAINKYFSIENWDFGDTFYFSELSAFVHQLLATQIGGIVLVPLNQEAKFGNLYDVHSASDEIFISCATVEDVEIVAAFTEKILRVN